MNKLIIFVMVVLCLVLSACTNANVTTLPETEATTPDSTIAVIEADIWDKSVATSFAGGSGSSADPYRISTAEQLAYLAKSVNAGTGYAGKSFILMNNLNLNGIEWTPIGNGTTSFQGSFNGNNHTIYDLKITKAIIWKNPATEAAWGIAGLFGTCENASIYGLKLENASVAITSALNDCDYIGIGTVIGRAISSTNTKFDHIYVNESSLKTPQTSAIVYEGGMIGYLQIRVNSWCQTDIIQSSAVLSSEGDYRNFLGGIIGYVSNNGIFEAHNLASYATVQWPSSKGKNYGGALAAVNSNDGRTELSNAFSILNVNHKLYYSQNDASFEAYSIIGKVYQDNEKPGAFKCENLFGDMFYKDQAIEQWASRVCDDIYYNYVESNCQVRSSLPTAHNYDTTVWDISSEKHPMLK